MQTAQLIYPQSNVAAMIAGRLSKSKGFAYTVRKVATGFEVLPLLSPTPALSALKALVDADKAKHAHLYNKVQYVPLTAPEPPKSGVTWTGETSVQLAFKFRGESPKYVDVWIDGVAKSFGKSTLISWDVKGNTGDVVVQMTKAHAKKRGLI